MKFVFILALLLLPTFWGCNDRLPVQNSDEDILLPLAKGNMWIGRLTTYGEDGSVLSTKWDTIMIRDEVKISVRNDSSDTETLESQTWYLSDNLEANDEGWQEDEVTWYRQTPEGLLTWQGFGTAPVTDEMREYLLENPVEEFPCLYMSARYPAQAGDTCGRLPDAQVLLPDPDNPGGALPATQIMSRYVEATDSGIALPFSSYYCNVYHFKILAPQNAKFIGAVAWQYIAPNVGPVLIEWYQGGSPATGRMTQKWELIEARLN